MKIIKPRIIHEKRIDSEYIIANLDLAARTCYKSEERLTRDNLGKVLRTCIKRGHTSVLEHVQLSFIITIDQGTLRELTRHRIASYSVESTRYCNYSDNNEGVKFIKPIEFANDPEGMEKWIHACEICEKTYLEFDDIYTPEISRNVLNLSQACDIRFTANLRSLRNVFTLRCAKPAHPHIKEVFIPLLLDLKEKLPIIFDDIEYDKEFYDMYLKDSKYKYVQDEYIEDRINEILKRGITNGKD